MKDLWLEWLQERQRHFFYGVLLVVVTLFIAFQIFAKFYKPKAAEYLVDNRAFEKWMLQGEAFEKLEGQIKQSPDLQLKFGALIADRFIVQNQGDKAEPFAVSVFEKVLQHTPDHAAFAKVSLEIAKGKLEIALSDTVDLHTRLDRSCLLYGFNLIRLASLHRALQHGDLEIQALKDLETYLQNNEKAKAVLAECFKEGNLTLNDYILQRKQTVATE